MTRSLISRDVSIHFTMRVLTSALALLIGASANNETNWCARCHGDAPPVSGASSLLNQSTGDAPLLPPHFSMNWDMHEFTGVKRPPIPRVKDPKLTIKGTTHFDASIPAMTEIYDSRCIDIFESGRDFSCQFLSVGSKTWFIKFSKDGKNRPDSCCKWTAGEFWAPRRDVVRNMIADNRGSNLNGSPVTWWILDIPMPGPFGYGFYTDGRPAAFWFPVISGWVQQEFRDFVSEKPAASVFVKPSICSNQSPVCKI